MKLPFARNRQNESLPPATAEQLLTNVFIACGREANSVPLEALTSYSNYRKERYALQRAVIIVILLLFLLLPLLFLAANIHVTLANPGKSGNPVYAVSVQTKIPIRQIQATLAGQNVPVYEDAPGEYTISPRENGEMRICVTLLNRQSTAIDVLIDTVDADAPLLLSTEFDADYVYFFVSDESGVDYGSVSVTSADGLTSSAVDCNPETGRICVAYPESPVTVLIPDLRGNALQIQLKPSASS